MNLKKSIISIIVLGLISIFFIGLVAVSTKDKVLMAQVAMVGLTFLIWVILLGALQYSFKDKVRNLASKLKINWKIKFVLFAIILVLIEEAITTTMTNLAPLFGVKIGEAFFTASTNYIDVVLYHSVIVFIPMFIVWSYLLSKYKFSAGQVLLLFGITGWITEAFFDPSGIGMIFIWIPIYGFMLYLPAYCVPNRDKLKKPKFFAYLAAIVLPYVASIIFVVFLAILNILGLYTPHPTHHF